ncbi:hypothetical protein RYX36_019591 [Vicia faba]
MGIGLSQSGSAHYHTPSVQLKQIVVRGKGIRVQRVVIQLLDLKRFFLLTLLTAARFLIADNPSAHPSTSISPSSSSQFLPPSSYLHSIPP